MTHMHILNLDGWAVARDGGRKPVLSVLPMSGCTLTRQEKEGAARLLVLALDMPGGIEAALTLLREAGFDYPTGETGATPARAP